MLGRGEKEPCKQPLIVFKEAAQKEPLVLLVISGWVFCAVRNELPRPSPSVSTSLLSMGGGDERSAT